MADRAHNCLTEDEQSKHVDQGLENSWFLSNEWKFVFPIYTDRKSNSAAAVGSSPTSGVCLLGSRQHREGAFSS